MNPRKNSLCIDLKVIVAAACGAVFELPTTGMGHFCSPLERRKFGPSLRVHNVFREEEEVWFATRSLKFQTGPKGVVSDSVFTKRRRVGGGGGV